MRPGQDLLWIARVHPRDAATLHLSVDGQPAAERVIPGNLGGHWLEIAALIPGQLITTAKTQFHIDVQTDGHYMPYYYWFYQGHYQPPTTAPDPTQAAPFAAHFDNGANLIGWQLAWNIQTQAWELMVTWQADRNGAHGGDKVFVHLVDSSGKIVAQVDQYPVHNTLPPGDWLPGAITDSYTLPATEGKSYQVLIGLYDPVSGKRVPVAGSDSTDRLPLGIIGAF